MKHLKFEKLKKEIEIKSRPGECNGARRCNVPTNQPEHLSSRTLVFFLFFFNITTTIIIYHQLSQAEQGRASIVQYTLSGRLHFNCNLGFTEKLFTLVSVWKCAGICQNVGQKN